jgi:hypothetical protein
MQLKAVKPPSDDGILAVRVMGADITGGARLAWRAVRSAQAEASSSPPPQLRSAAARAAPAGPLAFLLLMGGAWYGYTQGGAKGRGQQQGRWVYDRSLGGKKVGQERHCHVLAGVLSTCTLSCDCMRHAPGAPRA